MTRPGPAGVPAGERHGGHRRPGATMSGTRPGGHLLGHRPASCPAWTLSLGLLDGKRTAGGHRPSKATTKPDVLAGERHSGGRRPSVSRRVAARSDTPAGQAVRRGRSGWPGGHGERTPMNTSDSSGPRPLLPAGACSEGQRSAPPRSRVRAARRRAWSPGSSRSPSLVSRSVVGRSLLDPYRSKPRSSAPT
jgi:hypothetical protein